MRARLASALLSILALGACQQAPVRADNTALESIANTLVPEPPPDPAAALPALTGRVVDNANLLSPAEEAQLTTELAALERRTSDQLVIVTLPSLNGQTIEAFGVALGNHWRVGQRGKDNGVLLIVAPAEREVRIAVGLGLEAILTNARAQQIVERDLLPALRRRAYNEAIFAGTHQIAAMLVEHEAEPRRRQR
ncbi:MAG TPA: TPM domain-containing protein [Allosphingosinicella sp.]|nr:TPM domain-containing protein [Allosphingosinicella sp.]